MWNFRFHQIGESVWFSFRQFNFFLAIGEWQSVSVNPTGDIVKPTTFHVSYNQLNQFTSDGGGFDMNIK